MSSRKIALRNGVLAACGAGVLAGLVSRDNRSAMVAAAIAGGCAGLGSLLLGEVAQPDEAPTGEPIEIDV